MRTASLGQQVGTAFVDQIHADGCVSASFDPLGVAGVELLNRSFGTAPQRCSERTGGQLCIHLLRCQHVQRAAELIRLMAECDDIATEINALIAEQRTARN